MLKMVLRAAIWKSTPQPASASFRALTLSTVAALFASFVFEYAMAGAAARFSPYGINADVASLLITLTVAALFVRAEARTAFACAIMQLFTLNLLIDAALFEAYRFIPPGIGSLQTWALYAVIFVLYVGWWAGAVYKILRNLEPERRHPLVRTVGFWMVLVVATMALPYEPTFRSPQFQMGTANYWEKLAGYFNRRDENDGPKPRSVNRAQVELAQPALLEAQIGKLKPQLKGRTDIFTIGMAGFSDQDVFVKELNGGLQSLGKLLPLENRVVRLINHPDTVGGTPAASRQNFAAAVRAVGRVMDKDEDVLLLFMTSHGSGNGVSLLLHGAFYADLSPADVAEVFAREGIKNRVVIVSACYSGIFLKPLENENTIVMSAADSDRTSFGCSDEREWTYFGDALFNRSLGPDRDIEQAFSAAKNKIAQWEARDKLTPSNPQGYFGKALMAKLAPLYLSARTANAKAPAAIR